MLGAKSTLKDRWRQVLSEAEKLNEKHLLTLSPGISENQTDEMRAKRLQLVVPSGLHSTYRPAQQNWLLSLGQFITLVHGRQARVYSDRRRPHTEIAHATHRVSGERPLERPHGNC